MSDAAIDETPPTLFRLNALLAAGYRIDHGTSQKVRNAIWLDHPSSKRVQEPTLILYPSGLVVAESGASPMNAQLRFEADEDAEFNAFLSKVPRPTLWERSEHMRTNAVVLLMFVGGLALIWLLVNVLFKAVGLE